MNGLKQRILSILQRLTNEKKNITYSILLYRLYTLVEKRKYLNFNVSVGNTVLV